MAKATKKIRKATKNFRTSTKPRVATPMYKVLSTGTM